MRYIEDQTREASSEFWLILNVTHLTNEVFGSGLFKKLVLSDNPTEQLLKPLPGVLADLTLLVITTGGICANVLNIYSGAMSFPALVIKFGKLKWQRAVVAIVFGALGYLASRAGEQDFGRAYENFLLVIG